MNITSETHIYINIIGMQLPFSFFPIYGRNIRIYQISKIFHPYGPVFYMGKYGSIYLPKRESLTCL